MRSARARLLSTNSSITSSPNQPVIRKERSEERKAKDREIAHKLVNLPKEWDSFTGAGLPSLTEEEQRASDHAAYCLNNGIPFEFRWKRDVLMPM